MPKKPTAQVLDDQLDAMDDDTFAIVAADEKQLNVALQNPQTRRTGEATSIAKDKPSTIGRPMVLFCYPQIIGVTQMRRLNSPATAQETIDQALDPPKMHTGASSPDFSEQQDDDAHTLERCHRQGGRVNPV